MCYILSGEDKFCHLQFCEGVEKIPTDFFHLVTLQCTSLVTCGHHSVEVPLVVRSLHFTTCPDGIYGECQESMRNLPGIYQE
jgi:hypothetical protein